MGAYAVPGEGPGSPLPASSTSPTPPQDVVPGGPYRAADVRRLGARCVLCVACVVASNLLGSEVFSLGGTALFWAAPSIVAMFLALNERWMKRWLAAAGFVAYLVMILLDHGKIRNCLFLNLVFFISDAGEVAVVTACLQAVLAQASPSIIRTSAAINAILLFPLVMAPLKAGLNTLLVFVCFGPLHLPLSETLLIWLIGDFFIDFFLLYGVLVVRYYLSLYNEPLDELQHMKDGGTGEAASTVENAAATLGQEGSEEGTVEEQEEEEGKGGEVRKDVPCAFHEMEHAEEGRGTLLTKRTSSKKLRAAGSTTSSSSTTASEEGVGGGVSPPPLSPPGPPGRRPKDNPIFAWLRTRHAFLDIVVGVIILAVIICTSVASILNRTRIVRQPFFYLGSRLLFPVVGYVTVRYGQLGACFAVGVAAATMLVTDFFINEEKKTYGSIYISSFGTLFQVLVCPTLVVIVTWSISILAVALTERQDTLALLREKNTELVAQEKELREAKLAAEQALSSKTEFFARVSHEFRTPLNVVLGFSEELTKQAPGRGVALTSETADRIQYILAAGESLLRVVDDILELFRLSSSHSSDGMQLLQVTAVPVDISTFFSTVCDLVEVISKENGQLFIKHLDPSLPRCLVIDRGRLSQLVMNLASNACKYSRPVGGVVSIRLSNEGPVEDQPGFITLRLDVQDNGPGVPPELKDRIFESFFRGGPSVEEAEAEAEAAALAATSGIPYSFASPLAPVEVLAGQPQYNMPASSPRTQHRLTPPARSPGLGTSRNSFGPSSPVHVQPPYVQPHHKSKGHGLGLAITKQLVDLLHGRIELQSSVGLGSLFSIFLPVQVAEDSCCYPTEDGGGGVDSAGGNMDPPPIRGLKILSVEDIVVNQIVLGGMLQQDGHSVAFVETGTAALATLDATFDLILLDLQLPDMHGIDVLKTLRAHSNQSLATMPIVVVSALVLDKEKQECASAGADGFITKPVKLHTLRKEIRALSDAGRLRKGAGEEEGKEKEEGVKSEEA